MGVENIFNKKHIKDLQFYLTSINRPSVLGFTFYDSNNIIPAIDFIHSISDNNFLNIEIKLHDKAIDIVINGFAILDIPISENSIKDIKLNRVVRHDSSIAFAALSEEGFEFPVIIARPEFTVLSIKKLTFID